MARARCTPLALACALLAAAAFASADEICVGEPSLCEFGGPAWVIPFPPYEPIDVTTADTLKFSFTPNHNVYILPDAEAFDACSFGAPGAARNEAIPGSELVVDPSGVLELTVGGLEEGTIYFACSVGSHCFQGQRIEVKVAAAEPEPGAECPSIVDVALSVPDLSILVDAVVAANLTDVLSVGEDVYTVFAPTNDAFAELLGALGVDGLEDISIDTLTDVLLYHVVPGVAAYSTDLFDGQVIPTALEGLGLTVDLSDGVVIDGVGSDAAVIIPDVPACASVVHVIDAVLLPFGGAPAPEPEEGPFVVGLGEECNPTVSPAFQTICDDGLSCEVPAGLLGASGVCVED